MKQFTECTGYAAPLLTDDINTDLIVRIERMSQLKRGQFAPWAFESLRYHADGSENPAFILNQSPFRDAKILLSGDNFGCGSSREMAVWAIEEFGIRCIVASSYGDIFYNNCLQNGLLPVTLPTGQISLLAKSAARGDMLQVDLERCIIGTTQQRFHFDFPEEQRQALLQGLDDIDRSRSLEARITAFQQTDRAARPWIYAA